MECSDEASHFGSKKKKLTENEDRPVTLNDTSRRKCELCLRSFSTIEKKTNHVLRHGAMKYRCPARSCRNMFEHFANLSRHCILKHKQALNKDIADSESARETPVTKVHDDRNSDTSMFTVVRQNVSDPKEYVENSVALETSTEYEENPPNDPNDSYIPDSNILSDEAISADIKKENPPLGTEPEVLDNIGQDGNGPSPTPLRIENFYSLADIHPDECNARHVPELVLSDTTTEMNNPQWARMADTVEIQQSKIMRRH